MGGSREERKHDRKEEKRQERRAEKETRRERKRSEKEQHEKEKEDKKRQKTHANKENNKMEIECVEESEFVENSQDDKPVTPMVSSRSFEGVPDPCADTQPDMHETSDADENEEPRRKPPAAANDLELTPNRSRQLRRQDAFEESPRDRQSGLMSQSQSPIVDRIAVPLSLPRYVEGDAPT